MEVSHNCFTYISKSLFGGPKFLSKVLPETNLDTEFQSYQCQSILETINKVKN